MKIKDCLNILFKNWHDRNDFRTIDIFHFRSRDLRKTQKISIFK